MTDQISPTGGQLPPDSAPVGELLGRLRQLELELDFARTVRRPSVIFDEWMAVHAALSHRYSTGTGTVGAHEQSSPEGHLVGNGTARTAP